MVDIVMYGDQVDKMIQFCPLSPSSERSVGGVPVVGPIWRGGIEISGKFSGKLDGLELLMSKNLHPKIVELRQSLQKSICFRMNSRHALWPEHFDAVGAAHSDIELFMLPEVSRSEIDYDDLVEQMISNDLAMTSDIGNSELIIFTSVEQEDNQQHIQGKYYLWGILKGNGLKRCKTSKGKNTNAEKKRISKSMRASYRAKKSNSPLSASSVGHQPITTTQSAGRYNFVPSLSLGCKRPRSKRGRISRTLKEVGDVHKSVVADFPGMERTDQESNGVVPVKWHQTLDKLRQAKICTNIEQVLVENVPDITVMKKKPVMVTDKVDNLSKKDDFTSVVGGDVMKDGITNRGLCQLVARVDQLECQASDPLPEMDSCSTPVHNFEEPGPCSSSNFTLVVELDGEEDEQETTMNGTKIFIEGSGMSTSISMLNIADHFLETSSDTLLVQVGQYTIKSDLAPILTKILIKYGDIGLGCSMMPEIVLEKICKAFQDLEQVSFKDLRPLHLDRLRDLCELGEALEIDMKWLNNRCEDLEKTVLQLSQYPFLKKELAQCNNSIKSLDENVDLNRSTLVKLLEEKKLMEEEVESLTECREKLQCEIEDVGFQSRRFIGKSLVDGLF